MLWMCVFDSHNSPYEIPSNEIVKIRKKISISSNVLENIHIHEYIVEFIHASYLFCLSNRNWRWWRRRWWWWWRLIHTLKSWTVRFSRIWINNWNSMNSVKHKTQFGWRLFHAIAVYRYILCKFALKPSTCDNPANLPAQPANSSNSSWIQSVNQSAYCMIIDVA